MDAQESGGSHKVFIFDVDGVLNAREEGAYRKYLAEISGKTFEEMSKATKDRSKRLRHGEISVEEYEREVAYALGIKIKEVKWLEEFRDHLGMRDDVIQIARSLKADGHIIVIMTNQDRSRLDLMMSLIPGVADLGLTPADFGAEKKEKRAYEKAIEMIGAHLGRKVRYDEVVFVDDSPEKVAAASSLGIHAMLFTGVDALKTELGRYIAGSKGRKAPSKSF